MLLGQVVGPRSSSLEKLLEKRRRERAYLLSVALVASSVRYWKMRIGARPMPSRMLCGADLPKTGLRELVRSLLARRRTSGRR
jgi:hypothetical protein